jgi:hypothetical protein
MILFLWACSPISMAQTGVCAGAQQIWQGLSFPANVTGADGGRYQCLATTPNQTWLYAIAGTNGNWSFPLAMTPSVDIDFAAYGPYNSLADACANITHATPAVACDYSTANGGNINFNVVAGQLYVLLVTNYSRAAGRIDLGANRGSAVVSCIPLCVLNRYSVTGGGLTCTGEPVGLSGSEVTATYQLRRNGIDIGAPIAGTGGAISFGNQPLGTYTVVAATAGGACVPSIMTGQVEVAPEVANLEIAASANNICAGTSVTFSIASQTNQGAAPSYKWFKNNIQVGIGATYTASNLENTDVIEAELTSDCLMPSVVLSNLITMIVNPVVIPTIVIASTAPANTICAGTSVAFSIASQTNQGSAPTYQWFQNNVPVGTGLTYTSSTLSNNDVIKVELTSNAPCTAPLVVSSNLITTTVNPLLTPTIGIASNAPSNTIYVGTSVTFSIANQTNQGSAPTYKWFKNNIQVGTGLTYTTSNLANNDVVKVELTSNAICITPSVVLSNLITTTVLPLLIPSVALTSNALNQSICLGTSVTFTATPTHGGTTPIYKWFKNNVVIPGATANTLIINTLVNGDAIKVELTSNAANLSTPTALSDPIVMTVVTPILPDFQVYVVGGVNRIEAGIPLTFRVFPINVGVGAMYQWFKNGLPVGTNVDHYTDGGLLNGDILSCRVTNSGLCPLNATQSARAVTVIPRSACNCH